MDKPVEDRANRDGRALDRSHKESDGLAPPLRALLVQQPGPPCDLCGVQGNRGAEEREMTSVTLIRRSAARRAIVFEALATSEGMASWWGPDDLPVVSAQADPRVGGRFQVRFHTQDGLEHE